MSAPHNPQVEIDFLLNEIILCDDQYCPDLPDIYQDLIYTLISTKYPTIADDIRRCTLEGGEDKDCVPLFIDGSNRVNPLVHELLDGKRQAISPDPLTSYDGLRYNSPFWFEGAGDVWRRIAHNSSKVSIKDCAKLRQDAERCLADPTKPNDFCYRLYTNDLICEAGVHCTYMRADLLGCTTSTAIGQYKQLKQCIEAIPNYTPCTRGYVPRRDV
jgi:hypothetical protein